MKKARFLLDLFVSLLFLLLAVSGCRFPSASSEAEDEYGMIVMINGWENSVVLKAYAHTIEDLDTSAPLWTGVVVPSGQSFLYEGILKNRELGLIAVEIASPNVNHTLVKTGTQEVYKFLFSPLRNYEIEFLEDESDTKKWVWRLDDDPVFDVSNIAIQANEGSLTLRWRDPAMSDLEAVELYAVYDGDISQTPVETVNKGVQTMTVSGLIAGQEASFLLVCRYPEIASRGAAAAGTPLGTPPPAPTIQNVFPAQDAIGIEIDSSLSATFSVYMNSASITADSFLLLDGDDTKVSGTLSTSETVVTFTPNAPLAYGTEYTATITKDMKSNAGVSLTEAYVWSFTTLHAPLFHEASLLGYSDVYIEALAVGDLNSDGKNDLAYATGNYRDSSGEERQRKLIVHLYDEAGGLSETPSIYETSGDDSHRPITLAIGDLNGDGRDDVAVGNLNKGIDLYYQTEAGTLSFAGFLESEDSSRLTIADLNDDRLLDLAGIDWGYNTASVWYQDVVKHEFGAATTYSVTHGGWDAIGTGDLNNDSLLDLVVMSGQSQLPNVGILTQNESGGLNESVYRAIDTNNTLTNGLAVGDITGDGLDDIILSYGGNVPNSNIAIFAQSAEGELPNTPTAIVSSKDLPHSLALGDINGDYREDLIVYHDGWSCIGVYLQNSYGDLEAEAFSPIQWTNSNSTQALALGYLDGDGTVDYLAAITDEGVAILNAR